MSTKPIKTGIIISGGGIAGLTLGILLGRAGIGIRLIEPHPPQGLKDVKPSGRTVALMDSSWNIIKATGVWDRVSEFSSALKTMRIMDHTGEQIIDAEFPASSIGLEQFGFNVPNGFLRAALFEVVRETKNVTLHAPESLSSYEAYENSVAAKLANGTEIIAPLIVGADGRNSLVREQAQIESKTHDYHQKAITCLVNHSRSHNNTSTEFHRPAGPLALVPLPGNQSSVVWVEGEQKADELLKLRKEEFTQALQNETKDILGGITLETGPESWPLQTLKAKAMTAPRTALIAEAAHVMSPITAQGLNLSLRDVASLAETIVDAMRVGLDPGSEVMLGKFARRRRIDVNTRAFGVDGMNRIVSTYAPMISGLRRAGLKTVDAFAPLKNFAMQTGLAPQLDLGRLAKGEAL